MNNSYQNKLRDHFDGWSVVVIVLTFVLFAAALFVKGFTHDLFLEAGIFLVLIKLILTSHKNSVSLKNLGEEIKEVKGLLSK